MSLWRLKAGVPPEGNVRQLSLGLSVLGKQIASQLGQVKAGNSEVLSIFGDWGRGKSHALDFAREESVEAGFAVARLSFNATDAALNHPQRWVAELLNTLEVSDADGAGIATCLSYWLNSGRGSDIDLWCRQFASDSRCGETARRLGNWVRTAQSGAPSVPPSVCHELRHRGDAGSKRRAIEVLGAVSELLVAMGYAGLVLLFDEVESLLALPNVRSRAAAYRISWELFRAATPKPCLLVLAGTFNLDQQIKNDRSSLAWLGASDPAVQFLEYWVAPGWSRFELAPPTRRDLLTLIKRIVDMHSWAFDWSPGGDIVERMEARILKALEPNLPLRSCIQAVVSCLDSVSAGAPLKDPGIAVESQHVRLR